MSGGQKDDEPEKKGCKPEVFQKDYPRRVFFIISNEFCERFCYYGMKAVLQTYLQLKLKRGEDEAASLYHAFAIVSYFMPLPGAILADSFIGRYWTIFSLSIVYVIGNVIMATTAIGEGSFEGALIGMFTIAIGTGGIKPCVSSFGADQFGPTQSTMQKSFFSMFYVAINAGALISQFVTPIIKSISCFGEEECWVLAFGLPAALMVVALVLFLIGTPFYTKTPVTGSVALQMSVAIGKAAGRACGSNKRRVNHWLDRAVPDFSQEFVDECKAVLRVLLLYLPLPFFWALFDQTGSRWIYQAQKMNGYIDFLDWHVEPEQIQILNGLMVVCLVPVFDGVVYPLFKKCNLLVKPLQRMVAGCFLAAVSFIVIGFIQLAVQGNNDVMESANFGTYRARIFNVNPDCKFDLAIGKEDAPFTTFEPYHTMYLRPGRLEENTKLQFLNIKCNGDSVPEKTFTYHLVPYSPMSTIFFGADRNITQVYSSDVFPLDEQGKPQKEILFQILMSTYTPLTNSRITKMALYKGDMEMGGVFRPTSIGGADANRTYTVGKVPSQNYQLRYWTTYDENEKPKKLLTDMYLLQGGAYTAYVTERKKIEQDEPDFDVELLYDKSPNTQSVFLQAIPYLVLTFAEILFSITGLSFAFSQAPASMKSILTAGWLLTASFGNLIDLIIIEIKIPDKAIEFFLFAGLMFVVTVIFGVMTIFYVYVEDIEKKEDQAAKSDPEHHPQHPHAPHAKPMPTVPSMPYLTTEDDYKKQPIPPQNEYAPANNTNYQAATVLSNSGAYYNAAMASSDDQIESF